MKIFVSLEYYDVISSITLLGKSIVTTFFASHNFWLLARGQHTEYCIVLTKEQLPCLNDVTLLSFLYNCDLFINLWTLILHTNLHTNRLFVTSITLNICMWCHKSPCNCHYKSSRKNKNIWFETASHSENNHYGQI